MKISSFSSKKLVLILVLALFRPGMADAQQINERTGYNFKTAKTGYGLSRATVIEQQKTNGFGVRQTVTSNITQNSSSSVGTLTEVEAILNGDNSNINLTSTNTPTNSGTQTSTSNQTR